MYILLKLKPLILVVSNFNKKEHSAHNLLEHSPPCQILMAKMYPYFPMSLLLSLLCNFPQCAYATIYSSAHLLVGIWLGIVLPDLASKKYRAPS